MFEQDGFRVCLAPHAGAGELLRFLLPDPDQLLASGEIFKPGSRTHAARIELGGISYFLKRYNCRGQLYRLRHIVRQSRAYRTWNHTFEFIDRGVPVPLPLVMLEERCCRLLGRSYILMDFFAGSERLRDLWPNLEGGERRVLLCRLGEIFGRMHRSGCLHGDLKWDNILVRRLGSEDHLQLVDLDGSRILPAFRRNAAEKDLGRFLKDLEKIGQGDQCQSLLESWNRALARQ